MKVSEKCLNVQTTVKLMLVFSSSNYSICFCGLWR